MANRDDEPASAWDRIQQRLMPDAPNTSAVRPLKDYWKTGEGAARIRWGTDGDLTRCHRLVRQEAGVDAATFDVWGFCQNLHKELFGRPNPSD
jgi:hypothetical protein